MWSVPCLDYRPMCIMCAALLCQSYSLWIFIISCTPRSREAKRRPENSTQSSHAAARRQKEAAAKTKIHTNATERTPFPPKRRTPATPEGSFEEHTLAHSQKEKTKHKQNTDTHTIRVRLHTRAHARTRLHRNISALFAKAETGSSSNISGTIWKPIVKKGMHSIDILLS